MIDDKEKRKAEFRKKLEELDYLYTAEYLKSIDVFKYDEE